MTLWHFGGCLNIAKNNTNPDFSRFVLFAFGGSEGIRPTSLSAVSAVKRNATSFRLPETVANDGKGQRSIRKRLDCLCQTFSCATPCRAVFGGSGGIRPSVPCGGKCSETERYVISSSRSCRRAAYSVG